jgi:ABC-type multidrug transport system permease subunit
MLNKFFNLINNPRATYYIVGFFLSTAFIFALCYYFIPRFSGGESALAYQTYMAKGERSAGLFDCIYFSITSQTKVGYGDIVPVAGPGRFVASMQVVFSYFYLAFVISFYTARAVLKSDRFEKFLSVYAAGKRGH